MLIRSGPVRVSVTWASSAQSGFSRLPVVASAVSAEPLLDCTETLPVQAVDGES